MILNCSWILLECYQYYPILPILPILHNITNITQYYKSKIHQYSPILHFQNSIGGIQYQYYLILPILPNIIYSIFLNIPNPQNCAFPIQ